MGDQPLLLTEQPVPALPRDSKKGAALILGLPEMSASIFGGCLLNPHASEGVQLSSIPSSSVPCADRAVSPGKGKTVVVPPRVSAMC